MRKFILASAASMAAVVALAAPASAATIVLNEEDGTLSGGFDATVTDGSVDAPASFTREFTFTLPEMGVTSVSITTNSTVDAMTNLDFTSVLLNGAALTLSPRGGAEFGFLTNFPTMAGLQTLTVNGIARGNGSFGGNITFSPTAAVPEPATWALLLLGFAAVGFSMRRSKPSVQEARVRYNFA